MSHKTVKVGIGKPEKRACRLTDYFHIYRDQVLEFLIQVGIENETL